MKTREEHIAALDAVLNVGERHGTPIDSVADAIDYAIEQGMPVAPDPVEPVIGESLTEHTRLVDGMGVVNFAGALRQYSAIDDSWYRTGAAGGRTLAQVMRHGARIVYIPDVES